MTKKEQIINRMNAWERQIGNRESLLHHVENKDDKEIKKWEDKAEKGEIMRIM